MPSTSGAKETDQPSSSSVKDLIEYVFSLSTQDILNDDLYKHKVKTIPKHFESVQHYLGSYTMSLLEETHMETMSLLEETHMERCSQMEFMSGEHHAEVISAEESNLHGRSFLYIIKVECWRNRYGVYGKEPYSPKPLDLFILGDGVPEVALDLQRFGSSWSFASVVEDVRKSLNFVGIKDRLICFHVKTS